MGEDVKPTPRPWEEQIGDGSTLPRHRHLVSSSGEVAAIIGFANTEQGYANAAHIIACVNSHAEHEAKAKLCDEVMAAEREACALIADEFDGITGLSSPGREIDDRYVRGNGNAKRLIAAAIRARDSNGSCEAALAKAALCDRMAEALREIRDETDKVLAEEGDDRDEFVGMLNMIARTALAELAKAKT